MNVLITSGKTALSRALSAELAKEHNVVLTDLVDVETDCDFVKCELGHEGETEALVQGMDAIVHLAELPEELKNDEREIDFQTRCTYNIMHAAQGEKRPPRHLYQFPQPIRVMRPQLERHRSLGTETHNRIGPHGALPG